jgi:hypothetical protein
MNIKHFRSFMVRVPPYAGPGQAPTFRRLALVFLSDSDYRPSPLASAGVHINETPEAAVAHIGGRP